MEKSNIGLRILQRRKDLCLTQEELAERMGYKTKSSINKIEKGYNDVSQSKVVKFAEALHTTEAYLMGWTDDPDPRFEKNFPFFTKGDMQKFLSTLPPMNLKLSDGVIFDREEGRNGSNDESQSRIEFEDINKAFEFYKKYKSAIPPIQEAIRNLLKVDESDS